MPDITIKLTREQARAARAIDPSKTATETVQAHVTDWLAPFVQRAKERELDTVRTAFGLAAEDVQIRVRTELSLGEPE